MKEQPVISRRGCLALIISAGIIVFVSLWVVAAIIFTPSLAAQGSDILRSFIGDQAVSQIESAVFQVHDTLEHWRFTSGMETPSAPWPSAPPDFVQPAVSPTQIAPAVIPVTGATETVPVQPPAAIPEPSPMIAWMPPQVTPLGSLEGEGGWSAYIQDSSGTTVSYRTYLQPDPARPYAVVGVVAFDTSQTRLHFVLGSTEPNSPTGPQRAGEMPAEDKEPGVLLAMFNGGFKARHGQFGAMADGNVALPPRADLGTIGMYVDGKLQVGAWDSDIRDSPDLLAWRQNGPLVVHDGQINPLIYDNSPSDWGYTVKDVSPTWRSGIGLTADGSTFYYLCGPSLSMEMLAKSMLAAGIFNGIQLDINNYWVHFVAVRDNGDGLSLEPLFPKMMFENIDRYLYASSRDYFYVTLVK